MAREIRIKLHEPAGSTTDKVPAWAEGEQSASDFWYYVNELGEQWIAHRFNGEDVFACLDAGWEEVRVSAEDARCAL